ncbi:MAG: pyroglutamyl-peptidase I [Clostridia bacterium]|nr:pyroglutamyl-peptidase I [Clostridia bacterium]
MKILLTAFEPFGGEKINAAQEAAALIKEEIAGAKIVKMTVPVVFGKSIEAVVSAMRDERPDAVLCLGQAGGRMGLTPERVAINLDDARIPDNEGNQPVDQTIYPDGAPAYFSTLPVKAMVRAIQEAGVPASLSNTAGTFVCNHLMYGILYHMARYWPEMRGGFMHLPFLPEQVQDRPGMPNFSREAMAAGIEAAIKAMIEE